MAGPTEAVSVGPNAALTSGSSRALPRFTVVQILAVLALFLGPVLANAAPPSEFDNVAAIHAFVGRVLSPPPHDTRPSSAVPDGIFGAMPGLLAPSKDKEGKTQLTLVSNRLPITVKRRDDGQYDFSMSSGGLVTGISGLAKDVNFTWYGWPGLEVPEAERGPMIDTLQRDFSAAPVFGNKEDMDRHYNGFSSPSPLSGPRSRRPC